MRTESGASGAVLLVMVRARLRKICVPIEPCDPAGVRYRRHSFGSRHADDGPLSRFQTSGTCRRRSKPCAGSFGLSFVCRLSVTYGTKLYKNHKLFYCRAEYSLNLKTAEVWSSHAANLSICQFNHALVIAAIANSISTMKIPDI
jgi:hypothetical protein